jgi:hypothetical protein
LKRLPPSAGGSSPADRRGDLKRFQRSPGSSPEDPREDLKRFQQSPTASSPGGPCDDLERFISLLSEPPTGGRHHNPKRLRQPLATSSPVAPSPVAPSAEDPRDDSERWPASAPASYVGGRRREVKRFPSPHAARTVGGQDRDLKRFASPSDGPRRARPRRKSRRGPALAWGALLITLAATAITLRSGEQQSLAQARAAESAAESVADSARLQTAAVPAPAADPNVADQPAPHHPDAPARKGRA